MLFGAVGACAAWLGEGLHHRMSDRFGEQHGHRVADLAVAVRLGSRELEGVREGLHSRRLAHGECAVLFGMDVPVAVLGDVGGDAATQAVPVQPLVLVGEDV